MRNLHLFVAMLTASLVAGCAGPSVHADAGHAAKVIASTVATGTSRTLNAVSARPGDISVNLQRLTRLAPDADPGVLALALEARSCALRHGDVREDSRLAVIDYSRPSTDKRLWVFDLTRDRLLHREFVAHGSGSGENVAKHFSNNEGSYQTSLGLFRTAETYVGNHGRSLRLDGLDPGFNDNARNRAIVMHGAWYVNPDLARTQGRLGRSQGCPALREQVAQAVIDDLKQDNLIFSYADDAAWLQRGRSFACDGRTAQQILAMGRAPRSDGRRVASLAAS